MSHPNSLSQHTHGCARTLADINALYWVTSLLPLAFLSFWDTLQIVIWPGGTTESGLTSGLLISRAPRLPWSDKQLSFQELLEFFNYSRSWDGLQGRGGSISFVVSCRGTGMRVYGVMEGAQNPMENQWGSWTDDCILTTGCKYHRGCVMEWKWHSSVSTNICI